MAYLFISLKEQQPEDATHYEEDASAQKQSGAPKIHDLNISADGVVQSMPMIVLSEPEDGPDMPILTRKENKKLCKSSNIFMGKGISFIAGSLTLGLNKTEKNGGVPEAYISMGGMNPPDFKARAGWTQDFRTVYGDYRLVLERISKTYVSFAVYPIGENCP